MSQGSAKGPTQTDETAIHDDTAAEISVITEKVSPVGADKLLIEDSAASDAKKMVQITNLPGGADADAIHDNVASEISAITAKGTPVAGDFLVIEDSAAANAKKSVLFSALESTLDHGSLAGLADDDHTQYLNVSRHDSDDHSGLEETIEFSEVGTLTVKTGTFRWYPPYNITIIDVSAMVGVAPTGATVIVDVNNAGTTIFTTQGNRPAIAISGFHDVSSTADGDVTLTAETDYITVDIDQIGSTIAGDDLVVQVRYTRA